MFVNVSGTNHQFWEARKLNKAKELAADAGEGEIIWYEFPYVQPHAEIDEIQRVANGCYYDILRKLSPNEDTYFMVQGEFTLTHLLVNILAAHGFRVVVPTTQRKMEGNTPTNEFEFATFRDLYF